MQSENDHQTPEPRSSGERPREDAPVGDEAVGDEGAGEVGEASPEGSEAAGEGGAGETGEAFPEGVEVSGGDEEPQAEEDPEDGGALQAEQAGESAAEGGEALESGDQAEVEVPAGPGKRTLGERLKRSPFFRTRRRTIVTALVCIPLLLCAGYWLLGLIAFSDAARLAELKGLVHTRKESGAQWQLAQVNQLVLRKDRVRTGENSGARLLFFDVSTVDLEQNTEVTVMEVAKRRGGRAVDVVVKAWVGKTVVRAVRFVDPSSTFRVETPTASTVVRGARFTVDVAEDGKTQIDLQEGVAEVKVKDQEEAVSLKMGERITLQPDGAYQTEQVFEPDPQPMVDKVNAAWSESDDALRLELTEGEVNQFLAALEEQADFFTQGAQVWFVDGELRVAATILKPTKVDLSASVEAKVVDGKIEPKVKSIAAGVALPVPAPVLNLVVDTVTAQMEGYLAQAYDYVCFSDLQIGDGYIVIEGHKQPDAPVTQ